MKGNECISESVACLKSRLSFGCSVDFKQGFLKQFPKHHLPNLQVMNFLCPGMEFGGIYFFICLCVCCKKNPFNLHHNFWTVRDRDFIFGIYTQLMKPFHLTPMSMTSWHWPWILYLKKTRKFELDCRRGHSYFANTSCFDCCCLMSPSVIFQ